MSNTNPYSAEQHHQLYLADVEPQPNVASGSSVANMPTSMPPIPREQPELQPYDIEGMGIDSSQIYFDLGLAGSPDLKPEPMLQEPSSLNHETFGSPDFSVPALRPYDITGPGIDPGAFPTNSLPQLQQPDHPRGIDFISPDATMAVDPAMPDTLLYDRPENLIYPDPMQPDPLLPDLQHPDLQQAVHMVERPGEMAADADFGPDGDADDDDGPMPAYRREYQAPGLSARERRQATLYHGLRGDAL